MSTFRSRSGDLLIGGNGLLVPFVRFLTVPLTARSTGATTAVLWGIAFVLFGECVSGDLHISDTVLELSIYWLAAVAGTMFWATFMRIGSGFVERDWQIAYEVAPSAIIVPGRDRRLDLALARGLGRDRPADFWPPATWRLFGWAAAVLWLASLVATMAALSGMPYLPSDYRTMLVVLLTTPAVQLTAAAVIGPGVTRMLRLREGAREARRLVCEQGEHYELLHTLNSATPEQLKHVVKVLVELGYAAMPAGDRAANQGPSSEGPDDQ